MWAKIITKVLWGRFRRIPQSKHAQTPDKMTEIKQKVSHRLKPPTMLGEDFHC
jgi:hypothetical protein